MYYPQKYFNYVYMSYSFLCQVDREKIAFSFYFTTKKDHVSHTHNYIYGNHVQLQVGRNACKIACIQTHGQLPGVLQLRWGSVCRDEIRNMPDMGHFTIFICLRFGNFFFPDQEVEIQWNKQLWAFSFCKIGWLCDFFVWSSQIFFRLMAILPTFLF